MFEEDKAQEEFERLTRVIDSETCPSCFSKVIGYKDFSEPGHSSIEDGAMRRRICMTCGTVFGPWFL